MILSAEFSEFIEAGTLSFVKHAGTYIRLAWITKPKGYNLRYDTILNPGTPVIVVEGSRFENAPVAYVKVLTTKGIFYVRSRDLAL